MTFEAQPSPPMTGAGRATIKDVASLAGVSHQTVSRYLRNGGVGVRPSIQERIRTAITELGYRPNLAARAMRTRRTGHLAVLIPAGSSTSSIPIMEGIRATAHEAGFEVDALTLEGPVHNQTERATALTDSGLFEGVLALTHLEGIDVGETPLVEFPVYDLQSRAIGPLADATPIREIVSMLAEQGHRRFLHLAGDLDAVSAQRRQLAYREAISGSGLTSVGEIVCGWKPERAYQAICELPETVSVTAVICANDYLAAGAINGAVSRGWRIPEDVSITGFDENPMSPWSNPPLTTVAIDHLKLGSHAAHSLITALRGDPSNKPVPPVMQINWRASTGPVTVGDDNYPRT